MHQAKRNNEYINERNDLRHPRSAGPAERAPERFQEVFILKGREDKRCYR